MLRAYLDGDQLGDGSTLLMRRSRRQLLKLHESEDSPVTKNSDSSSSTWNSRKLSNSGGQGVAAIARSAAAAVVSGRRALTGAAGVEAAEAEASAGAGWRLGRRLVQQEGGGGGGGAGANELSADEEADEVSAGVGLRRVGRGHKCSLHWCFMPSSACLPVCVRQAGGRDTMLVLSHACCLQACRLPLYQHDDQHLY